MLVVDCINYDAGKDTGSMQGLIADIVARTKDSWKNGADVVMYPEYTWANAVKYASPMLSPRQLAEAFWPAHFQAVKDALCVPGKTVVLGTVPRLYNGELRNTCIIFNNGDVIFQDKLALTPWESDFKGGENIEIFKIGSLTCAVLVCLDIEMPDLAQSMKEFGQIDVLFVPSATDGLMGVERIARCATSRAVELACAVITCALTGEVKDYEFIDINMGRAAMYLPSLIGFENIERVKESAIEKEGGKLHRFEIDADVLSIGKNPSATTNPARISTERPISIRAAQKISAAA